MSLWGSDKLGEYLKKGKEIAVSGSLEYREWEKDGNKRSVIEFRARDIKFFGGKDENAKPESQEDDGSEIPF